MNKPKIKGLIVAAGLSGRMKSFKPLTDYKGKPFIINIILKLEVICDQIFIVTGHNEDDLKSAVINDLTKANQTELLKKIFFIYNDSFQKGMFTSLQKGILTAKNRDWILYHFVDQPGLPEIFYNNFILQIDNQHNWIQPSYKNQHGHPILLGKDLFELINNSSPDSNLREISNNPIVKKKYWGCNYKEIFQDIDTEEDYSKLQ